MSCRWAFEVNAGLEELRFRLESSGGVVGVDFDSHRRTRTKPVRLSLDIPFPYRGDQQTMA